MNKINKTKNKTIQSLEDDTVLCLQIYPTLEDEAIDDIYVIII